MEKAIIGILASESMMPKTPFKRRSIATIDKLTDILDTFKRIATQKMVLDSPRCTKFCAFEKNSELVLAIGWITYFFQRQLFESLLPSFHHSNNHVKLRTIRIQEIEESASASLQHCLGTQQ